MQSLTHLLSTPITTQFNKRNLDVSIFGVLFVVRCLFVVCSSQRCLQRAITASSYYKSFPCNDLLTPDQTRPELPLGSFFSRIRQKFGKTHCKITLNSEKFCQKSECSDNSDWQDRCKQPRGATQRLARGPRTSS